MGRLVLVDDHPMVMEGLARLLTSGTRLEVCGTYTSGEEALRALKADLPDVLIAEISLSDLDGLELIRRARDQHPGLPILILSMHDESLYAERVLAAGARGYLMKKGSADDLLEAVHRVLGDEIYLSERMTKRLLKGYADGSISPGQDALSRLTDREIEVLRGIGQGRSTRDMAESLGLSIKTIESYRANLKLKLNLEDGHELVRYAVHWIARGGAA